MGSSKRRRGGRRRRGEELLLSDIPRSSFSYSLFWGGRGETASEGTRSVGEKEGEGRRSDEIALAPMLEKKSLHS